MNNQFNKGDLVYAPIIGRDVYEIEEVIDDRIVIKGNFINIYMQVAEYIKPTEPVAKGNVNVRTGFVTNEGRVLINTEEWNPTVSLDVDTAPPEYVTNLVDVTSNLIYPATFVNHALLEALTGQEFQEVMSSNEIALELLIDGPILAYASSDMLYEDLVASDECVKLIARYDTENNLFYDSYDTPYSLVVPIDNRGRPIERAKPWDNPM